MTLTGSLTAKGRARVDEPIPRPDETYSVDAAFTEGDGDFTACEAFIVTAELKAGGKIVWQGRLAINQDCPD